MVSRRNAIHAHVSGHADALLGLATLASPSRARRDRTRRPMLAFRSVRSTLPAEMVPLHDTRSPLALAGADHIDELHFREQINPLLRPGRQRGRILESNLPEMPHRPH